MIFIIKAVIFDLDGTLVNSLYDIGNAVNIALSSFGFKTHGIDEYKYFVGNGIKKTIERALPEDNRDIDTINRVYDRFNDYYSVHFADNTVAYDGMKELIAALKDKGLKLAVVTNKSQRMAQKVVLDAYGDVFDLIFGKRDGIPAKPDPTSTLNAMKELEVKPCECVFLGDSGVDVLTGANSGALPVGELWGYRDENELKDNKAEYIISKPQELLKIIEEVR